MFFVIPFPSWKTISEFPWKSLFGALQRFAARKPFNLVLCVLLLFVSLYLLKVYWQRSSYYESMINSTLRADLEPTSQNFPGLEAFILSNLTFEDAHGEAANEKKDFVKSLGEAKFSADFLRNWDELQRELKGFVEKPSEQPVSIRIAKGQNDGLILTDDLKPTEFLFLPVYILRPAFSLTDIHSLGGKAENDEAKQTVLKRINEAVNQDKDLMTDVRLTAALSTALNEFPQTPLVQKQEDNSLDFVESRPAQVYMITKNGLNRIFTKRSDAESYYGNQFTATTFFPSRPYFWPVFQTDQNKVKDLIFSSTSEGGVSTADKPAGDKPVKEFFYITKPYMDLGGNGFVMTLSRGIQMGGVTQAVICFDLVFAPTKKVDRSLADLVHTFNGTVIYADCDVETAKCDAEMNRGDTKASDDVKNRLVKDVEDYIDANRVPHERSILAGSIRVINSKNKSDEIHISVPTEGANESNSQKVTLLLLSLNLPEFKRVTTWFALFSSLSFGVMLLMLTFWLASMARVQKEYEGAFKRVARVMYKSPTPYVRLDSEDRIHESSLSFCEKLGYPANKASVEQMKKFRFRDLVADDDLDIYDQVQEQRVKREEVRPYRIKMKRKDGSSVPVEVISADVPSSGMGKLPETFGILLDPEDHSAHGKPPEPTADGEKDLHDSNVIAMRKH